MLKYAKHQAEDLRPYQVSEDEKQAEELAFAKRGFLRAPFGPAGSHYHGHRVLVYCLRLRLNKYESQIVVHTA